MNDDKQLIEKVLAGDTSAFEGLVQRYQDRLFNTLVHVSGSVHEAEELVQDTLLQAFTKLHSFHGKSSLYTWLYRIAFNLAVSRGRKRRPRVSLDETREHTGIDPIDPGTSPELALEQSERAQQVAVALARLSDEYRSVLILREMDDHDYDTISEMLEIPVGTVRSRLHRARSMLREQLEQLIGER